MKLYAEVTNENGKTAGTGGNEWLDVDIKVGNQFIARFTLRWSDDLPETEGSGWILYDNNNEPIYWIEKGEKYSAK